MDSFAFIIHPIHIDDVTRKFDLARYVPESVLENALKLAPPIKVSEITGVESKYNKAKGWFIACPMTSRQLIHEPVEQSYKKIISSVKVAQRLGARIVGLGAMTSVVGDAGITINDSVDIPITTGNSYTVATAVQGIKKAAQLMDIDYRRAEILVIGATGSIGKICAEILARDCRYLTLSARNSEKLEHIARKIMYETGIAVNTTDNLKSALKTADLIISVSSAIDTIIEPKDLKSGSVVCDVARPRDVSLRVAEEREDVLVIEGGLVKVPGNVDFNFNFGFPPGYSYACMAETMILALEKKYEAFSLGRDLTINQVDEISDLAKKHGFELAGFRSFERPVTMEKITRIKSNAMHKISIS